MDTASKADTLTAPRASVGARLLRSREAGILVALALMVVLLSTASPEFRTADNLLNNARNLSFVGIVALGQAMVMITGGIDLSAGSVWGLTAVSTAALMAQGWPTPLAVGAGLGIAAVFGLFNGLCVTKLRMPPFVPTLATMSIARALALVITRGKSINDFRPEGDLFFGLGGGDTFGLPNPFLLFLALVVLVWIVLDRTVFGRQLYAVGGNERAAKLSGLEVDRLKITVYVISAVHAGLAGVVEVSYLSSAIANQGPRQGTERHRRSGDRRHCAHGRRRHGARRPRRHGDPGSAAQRPRAARHRRLLAGHLRRRGHHTGRVHRPTAQGPLAKIMARLRYHPRRKR